MLDLFAGTGAMGIEAISRGAEFVLFVDQGAEARALLRENVAALGLGRVSRIFRRDATKLGEAHPVPPFSLAFLDPPYGQGLAAAALASARAGGWFTPDALVVVEEAAKAQFVAPEGFTEVDRRRYDDSEFVFLRDELTSQSSTDLFGKPASTPGSSPGAGFFRIMLIPPSEQPLDILLA